MTGAHRGCLTWIAAGAAAMLLCTAPRDAVAGGKIKTALTATRVDTDAQGQTGLGVRGTDGTFDVKVRRLDRRASYDLVVKGVRVGTLQTNGSGSGRLRFRSHPRSKDRVLGFDPRGAQLSVRDGSGHDVLVGTTPATTIDPSAVACCVPDTSGGSSCQELTPDACTAASGTASPAASCIPDPCATTPPPASTVCCTNETGDDESESECEDEDATDCAAAGGTVVEATSCDPNPCAPVPPPAGDIAACCVPEEDETETETECEVITTEACAASKGTAMTGATCEPDPCAGGDDDGDDDDDDDDGDDDDDDDDGGGGDDGGGDGGD